MQGLAQKEQPLPFCPPHWLQEGEEGFLFKRVAANLYIDRSAEINYTILLSFPAAQQKDAASLFQLQVSVGNCHR